MELNWVIQRSSMTGGGGGGAYSIKMIQMSVSSNKIFARLIEIMLKNARTYMRGHT